MHTPNGSNTIMPDATGLSGFAAVKIALAIGLPAALAAALGMLLMPPKSPHEFAARTACTVVCSFVFGPILAMAAISWMPSLMDSAHWIARRTFAQDEDLLALLYVLGPCMLLAGLPAWWLLGAYLRLTAKLQSEDLIDWAVDIRRKITGKRPDDHD